MANIVKTMIALLGIGLVIRTRASQFDSQISLKTGDNDNLDFTILVAANILVGWKHLIKTGTIDMIDEVELWKKDGPHEIRLLETVKPTELLITDKLSICDKHTKIWIKIKPKLGFDCHPDCNSIYSEFNPLEEIQNTANPTYCVEDPTTAILQFNIDNRFLNCEKLVVEVHQHQGSKTSKITSELHTAILKIGVKIDNGQPTDISYTLHFKLKKTSGDKHAKKVHKNVEQKCASTNFPSTLPPISTRPVSSSACPTLTTPTSPACSNLTLQLSSSTCPSTHETSLTSVQSGAAGFFTGLVLTIIVGELGKIAWKKWKGRETGDSAYARASNNTLDASINSESNNRLYAI